MAESKQFLNRLESMKRFVRLKHFAIVLIVLTFTGCPAFAWHKPKIPIERLERVIGISFDSDSYGDGSYCLYYRKLGIVVKVSNEGIVTGISSLKKR